MRSTAVLLALSLMGCGDDDGPPSSPRVCDGTDHDGNGVVDDMEPPCVPCQNDRLTFEEPNPQHSSITRFGRSFAIAWEDGADHVARPRIALVPSPQSDGGLPRLEPITVSEAATMIAMPTLVAAGNELVVAWEDARSGFPGVYARRFSETLEPLSTEELVVAGGTWPRLAYSSSAGLGLVYGRMDEGVSHVAFVALSPDLTAGTPIVLDRTGAGAGEPAIAAASGGFGVVFSDLDEEGEIYFSRLEQGMEANRATRVTTEAGRSAQPVVAWSGSEYGVAWVDARVRTSGDVLFLRLDREGLPVSQVEVLTEVEGGVYYPTLAASSNAFFLAWNDLRLESDAIYGAVLYAGMPPRIHELSGETVATGYPSATATGDGFALSWYDGRTGANELYMAHVGGSAYCDAASSATP